jgi:hypothetical protein
LACLAHRLAQAHGGAPLEAAALGLVGICERRLHRLEDAVRHLQDSIDRSRELPNATERESIMAELVLALIDAGREDDALRVAAQLEPLDAGRPDWDELSHPQLIPWAVSRAYLATGARREAADALDCARAIVAARLGRIANATWRRRYEAWGLNRAICGVDRPISMEAPRAPTPPSA